MVTKILIIGETRQSKRLIRLFAYLATRIDVTINSDESITQPQDIHNIPQDIHNIMIDPYVSSGKKSQKTYKNSDPYSNFRKKHQKHALQLWKKQQHLK